MIKVIAFDVFGTVFDLSQVDRSEVREYVDHIRQPTWQPLHLPEHWERLPAFPDAAEGIARLRTKYQVVTLTNGPVRLITRLSKFNGISWDMIIPIETQRIYKPDPQAYTFAAKLMNVWQNEVLMVTANKTFGDLEAATELGMKSQLIRGDGCPQTIIELADKLT